MGIGVSPRAAATICDTIAVNNMQGYHFSHVLNCKQTEVTTIIIMLYASPA